MKEKEMTKAQKFILEIANALEIKPVISSTKTSNKVNFIIIAENGLNVISHPDADEMILITYQPPFNTNTGEIISHSAIVSSVLKYLVINAYKNARLEIEKLREIKREQQIKLFGV